MRSPYDIIILEKEKSDKFRFSLSIKSIKVKGMGSMSRYSGTQTEKNLEAAFAGESQARNKYTYFASVAKKEGYEQIGGHFPKNSRQRERTCQDVV